MKNFKNIQQKTEAWHEIKWGRIGGTLSKGLFVKSDTLLIDLLYQRCEDFIYVPEGFINDAMERGNTLEPLARVYLEEYLDVKFEETGWIQSEENELLGMSPDGLTEDETIQCEIKCFGGKKHYETLLADDIPLENIHQCLHAFTVNTKLEKLYFIAFRPESPKPFIKMLDRNSEINMGTKAKPKMFTIIDAVAMSLYAANELLTNLKLNESQLKL